TPHAPPLSPKGRGEVRDPLPRGRGESETSQRIGTMAKARSQALDLLVYLLVRLLVCVLQGLSYEAARAFAGALAWLAYRVDRRHREVAFDNLRHAFPGRYTPRQLDDLVKKVYLHFCILVVELVHLP